MTCPCVKCGKALDNLMDGQSFQPMGGTAFRAFGHYGSTVFDPMDGSSIEIVLCDDCLSPVIGTPAVFAHGPQR